MYSELGFLDRMAVLFLIFKGISVLFSIMNVVIYIVTKSVKVFPLHHTLTSLVNFCLVYSHFTGRREVMFHCGLHLHFHGDY